MGGGIEHLTVLIRIKLTAGLDPKFLTVLDLYLYLNCKWFAIKCQYVTQHAATVDPQHSLTNRTSLASEPFGKKVCCSPSASRLRTLCCTGNLCRTGLRTTKFCTQPQVICVLLKVGFFLTGQGNLV